MWLIFSSIVRCQMKGSLQIKSGMYYVVVDYKNEYDKRKQKWISTDITSKNNKTKALAKMKEILKTFEINDGPKQIDDGKVLFTDFLQNYLSLKKENVEPITYNTYTKYAEKICKYFKSMRIALKDLKPYHIEGFYKTLYDKGLVGNSVVKYHILIRECLQYAVKNDFILSNVADKVGRPKISGYKANFYSKEEIEKLFNAIKNNEIKIPIMLSAIYGFRRSEVIGLKWNAIDFDRKTISIQHKVLETKIDGKRCIYMSDKLKTKTSNRTLPLLPQAEQLLSDLKEKIEKNKKMLGSEYITSYEDYVCVDNLGKLILPARLTHNFNKILKTNGLKHIRFHDLRHSCASLMLANGISMKQIQEWLGHANFATTANIYSHLDFSSKLNSANTISNVFNFTKEKQESENIDNEIQKLQILLQQKLEEKKRKNDYEM